MSFCSVSRLIKYYQDEVAVFFLMLIFFDAPCQYLYVAGRPSTYRALRDTATTSLGHCAPTIVLQTNDKRNIRIARLDASGKSAGTGNNKD